MIVSGSMIGSGIFIVSADIARSVGSSGYLLLVWILSSVMTTIVALSYGEASESPDLLAVHRPTDFPEIWAALRSGRLRPGWVVVENREPDPRWCRLLEEQGYRLKFYFHDDEYFEKES